MSQNSHAHASAHGEAFSLPDMLGIDPLWVATGILILTYAVLITEKVNRAILAMLGASLMVLFGILNQEQAVGGVDANTLALLIGMMVIVGITSKSGLFQYVAIVSSKWVKANPTGILVMLTLITAVFSALLDNVTTVLLIAPITLLITDALETPVFPFFLAEILASNVGGTATLIGDPPQHHYRFCCESFLYGVRLQLSTDCCAMFGCSDADHLPDVPEELVEDPAVFS